MKIFAFLAFAISLVAPLHATLRWGQTSLASLAPKPSEPVTIFASILGADEPYDPIFYFPFGNRSVIRFGGLEYLLYTNNNTCTWTDYKFLGSNIAVLVNTATQERTVYNMDWDSEGTATLWLPATSRAPRPTGEAHARVYAYSFNPSLRPSALNEKFNVIVTDLRSGTAYYDGQAEDQAVGSEGFFGHENTSSWSWTRNGQPITIDQSSDASRNSGGLLTIASFDPATDAGVYVAKFTNPTTSESISWTTILGVASTAKAIGSASEVASDIYVEMNHNTFDQVLLSGASATVTADSALNQITRTSFIDLDDDIVQVEYSGPGTLTLVLDNPTIPTLPINYNQDVKYVKGHASITITGANEFSNVSVFSVGKITAVNQSLFKEGTHYDGIADIAFIAIATTNGKFGGVRTANANYFASRGYTGIYAPGVEFTGPVYLGDVSAFDSATPVIMLGSADGSTLITGGDLLQANNKAVQVSGLTKLSFAAGTDSHGNTLPAQVNKGRLEQGGVDVTATIVK